MFTQPMCLNEKLHYVKQMCLDKACSHYEVMMFLIQGESPGVLVSQGMTDAKIKLRSLLGADAGSTSDSATVPVDPHVCKQVPIDSKVRLLAKGIRESTSKAVIVSAIVGEFVCQVLQGISALLNLSFLAVVSLVWHLFHVRSPFFRFLTVFRKHIFCY